MTVKHLIIICALVLFLVVGLGAANGLKVDSFKFFLQLFQTQTTGKITKGMALKNYHEIKVNDNKIQIGDKNSKVMKPVVSFSKKNGDSVLTLNYPVFSDITSKAGGNKITWEENSQDISHVPGVSLYLKSKV